MNELLTPEQLAERLGVPLRMVREMYYTNSWPHLRLNKRTVRFTDEHLEQIIAMSERRPTTDAWPRNRTRSDLLVHGSRHLPDALSPLFILLDAMTALRRKNDKPSYERRSQ
jgi:DNA-directed RNA polymerase sigma subunit (sigma70/sigma32)